MADVVTDERPLTLEDLVRWFEAGEKPAVGDQELALDLDRHRVTSNSSSTGARISARKRP